MLAGECTGHRQSGEPLAFWSEYVGRSTKPLNRAFISCTPLGAYQRFKNGSSLDGQGVSREIRVSPRQRVVDLRMLPLKNSKSCSASMSLHLVDPRHLEAVYLLRTTIRPLCARDQVFVALRQA